jgi:Family of unknown function (DUF5989)
VTQRAELYLPRVTGGESRKTILTRRKFMKFVRNATRNLRTVGEMFSFFGGRRWWILPIIATLFLLGAFIVVAQSSSLAPFIYTMF